MARCPKGHDSATTDYCDVCGIRMDSAGADGSAGAGSAAAGAGRGRSIPAGAATPAPDGQPDQTPCPVCGTPRTGRFCEQDGYDFVAAALGGGPPAPPAG